MPTTVGMTAAQVSLMFLIFVPFFWNSSSVNCSTKLSKTDNFFNVSKNKKFPIEGEFLKSISSRSISQSSDKTPNKGVWINNGRVYPRCSALHYQKMQCSNFSLTHLPMSKEHLWKPNCGFLMHRLICALYKTNCPGIGQKSFQMYDVPCQISCYSTVSVCGLDYRMENSLLNQKETKPFNTFNRWGRRSSINPSQSVWPWRPLARPSHVISNQPMNENHPKFPNGFVYPKSRQRRHTISIKPPSDFDFSESQIKSKQVNSQLTKINKNTSLKYQLPSSVINHIEDEQIEQRNSPKTTWLRADESDCAFLPAGNCDDWAESIANLHSLEVSNFENKVKQNVGCMSSLDKICTTMFPEEFTKSNWIEGNFTVAFIMRITQTFWWFGGNNRFQPFFRFQVKRILKTDIQPYDDKVILTHAWPVNCVCGNQLTVGKRYLVLTHSKVSRQTLRISKRTVFLQRAKRYAKRLSCWLGSCPRKMTGVRRRYPRTRWNHRWPHQNNY